MRLIYKTLSGAVLSGLMACSVLPALATQDIQYSGTLIDTPPCTINDGQLIEIDFGEMGVNKIGVPGEENDEYWRLGPNLLLACPGLGNDIPIFVRYLGNATAFDNASVQSSLPDFGIQMRGSVGGGEWGWPAEVPIPIGEGFLWRANSSGGMFTLLPVKKPGVKLQGGSFVATARLQLEYP